MKHRDTEFAYGVAKVKALLAAGLDKAFLKRTQEAESLETALSLLRDKGYQGDNAEEMLEHEMEKTYDFLTEISPSKEAISIFRLRRDYQNVKLLLKADALGRDASKLLRRGGNYHPEFLQKALAEKDFSTLGELGEIAREAERLLSEKKPQEADCLLDRAAFSDMQKRADNPFVKELLVTMIDLENLTTLLRFFWRGERLDVMAFLPGGTIPPAHLSKTQRPEELIRGTKYKDLALFVDDSTAFLEKRQDYLDGVLQKARWESFGIGPILSYLFFKEREVRLLRQILGAKKRGEILKEVSGKDA